MTDRLVPVEQLAPALGADEARRLTDEVKRDVVALREKLLRLYEGAAHLALGYTSWRSYWEAEFETHWRSGYRELEAARVDRVIDPWVNGPLPERQARELAPLLDDEAELVEVWRELRAEHGGQLTAEKVREAVSERLERDRSMAALKGSSSDEWYSPPDLVEAVRTVLGAIDLDPASCATANKVVKAAGIYTEDDDGLQHEWRGRVYLNPPYKRAGVFVTKLAAEYDAGRVDGAVVILNAQGFDAAWWSELWARRPLLCFTDRRVRFWNPWRPSESPQISNVLAYLGSDANRFHEVFAEFGFVVERRWLVDQETPAP